VTRDDELQAERELLQAAGPSYKAEQPPRPPVRLRVDDFDLAGGPSRPEARRHRLAARRPERPSGRARRPMARPQPVDRRK
jgi:hypothetical protein